jgi:hypothetical protein
MTTTTDSRERGGATSVQVALLWIAMLAFILAVVQAALLYLAGQLALTAAEDGLRSGRYYGVGSAEQARRGAEDFIARTAGTTLAAPTVEAVISDDGATMQVTVSGTVLAVVPGLELRVAKQAIGAIEQVTR